IPFFNQLNNNENLNAIGYGEKEPGHVARLENCDLDPTKSKYCLDFWFLNKKPTTTFYFTNKN
ncbi:MAG: hypothetical protein ACOVNP_06685, partial [Flavobacterium sp.]